jgi:hypothetical protein
MLTPSRAALLAALAGSCAGCSDTLDAADLAALPSIEGYQTWKRHEQQGFAPGHRESFRRIFVNAEVERTARGAPFPAGAVIVKEIYELAGTPQQPAPGALRYMAIMRRPAVAPDGITLDAGWVFTSRRSAGAARRRVPGLRPPTARLAAIQQRRHHVRLARAIEAAAAPRPAGLSHHVAPAHQHGGRRVVARVLLDVDSPCCPNGNTLILF